MSKIFVLCLEALLSSENTTQRFDSDNQVVIPFVVIDQLRNYRGTPEKRKIADKLLAYLESFDIPVLLSKGGAIQDNGSTLRIVANYHDEPDICLEGITQTDARTFKVCKGLEKENPDKKVILVSKEATLRIRARSIGINAEDFKDDLFPSPREQYTGRTRIETDKTVIEMFYEKGYVPMEKIFRGPETKLEVNQFAILSSKDGFGTALGRYDGEKLVKLNFTSPYPYGIMPKSSGQQMLIECLCTNWEEAPLVIAKGSAGTGKTYCSLAVALSGIDAETYNRILVATPSETVGNERLGFLPGDIKEKVSPYLGGIRDNLYVLLGESKKVKGGRLKEKDIDYSAVDYYFDRGIIQVQPIGFLRGRTIVNSIFIIDETQNIEPGDIKSIVTRAAEGSKFIFLGDPTQVDNPKLNERYNGLVYLSERMKGNPLCWQITLGNDESVRSDLSTVASEIL